MSSASSFARTAGGIGSVMDFFSFPNKTLPAVVAPVGASGKENDWEDKPEVEKPVRNGGLDYINKYVEEERVKIDQIKLSGAKPANMEESREGGRGRRGGGGARGGGGGARGRDNFIPNERQGRGDFSRRQRNTGDSIYGTIPDNQGMDSEVFIKYDFNQRVCDTSELVINRVREKILTQLVSHQIMTIEGFTGCGKTTQVPQFILDEAVRNDTGCRIAATQPRRIAAISVANRVASERNWRIGGIIGYQVGMDKRITEDTRLTYMTTGVLLQLLISRKSLGEWTHIIIDEVHERDLETDLLLLVLKKIMVDTANSKTKIILMSATLNPDKFKAYFPLWTTDNLKGCVNIKVDLPNQFPVEEFYVEDAAMIAGYENFSMDGFDEPKAYQECFEIATKVLEGLDIREMVAARENNLPPPEKAGAVLVFLPGLLEIETFYKVLSDVNVTRGKNPETAHRKWSILPLHSSITNEGQQRVFIPAKGSFRKIILATNIAESSITVPDIKYVIDFCLTKNLSCDSATNITCLRLEWASKNQCIQRRGRCGRVSAGICYRMVTKKFYHMLEQEASPEMLRSSLESVVLQVKLLAMGSPQSVLALAVDPPDASNIQRAVCNLKEIGALTIQVGHSYDSFDGNLTFVGRVLSRLPIDIRLGRLILLGHVFDCLEEAVVIAAGLSVKSPFACPYTKRLEAYLSKLSWSARSFSDCIALLKLYMTWFRRHQRRDFQAFPDERTWSKSYFAQITSLREMKVLIDELYKRLRLCGIEPSPQSLSYDDQLILLKVVIAGAFYPNYFTRARPNPKDYQKEISRDVAGKNPFASVVFQGFPMEQPGELYKKIIAKFVRYQNCIPHLEFHGSRVVVTFESRGSYIGPIGCAVYRAIKLRQLRQVLTFYTPSRDVAYKLVNERKMLTEVGGALPSPRPDPMPGLRTSVIQVVVTQNDSPSEFYVVLKSNESQAHVISQKLSEASRSLTCIRRDQGQPGQLCVICWRGKFYRGRIDDEGNNDNLMIYLIDRGLSLWFTRNNVYSISKEVLEAGIHMRPALAMRCRLQEIRPSLRTDCVWTQEALCVFQNYCVKNENQVSLHIYGISDGIIVGDLKNTEDAPSITEILLEKKYADKCREPQPVCENHFIRVRVKHALRDDTLSNFRTLEELQNSCPVPEKLYDLPRMSPDSEQAATLRGPHSPLEMTFTSLFGSAHLKQVVTDSTSINSVALDQDPTSPTARLMVAANVAIAQRSGNILARETTIMPPIPGLTGILAMLFCPKIEFRVNDNCTTYAGCLTGLGVNPATGESAYPDHDMEIVFDTVIDNEDIDLVNSIRSAMNAVLSERVSSKEISSLRDRMRLDALRLLERERKSMEEIWPDQTHQWNMIDEERVIQVTTARDAETVFPLHPHINLSEKVEGEEDEPPNRNMYNHVFG